MVLYRMAHLSDELIKYIISSKYTTGRWLPTEETIHIFMLLTNINIDRRIKILSELPDDILRYVFGYNSATKTNTVWVGINML